MDRRNAGGPNEAPADAAPAEAALSGGSPAGGAPSGAKEQAPREAYRAAGVDVDAGERAVALMRGAVESTRRPEVVGGLGGFAGAIGLPAGLREPVLVASTDGVGTKVALGRAAGRLEGLGRDLVAMCADDVACSGAAPLFLLDYVAVPRVIPEEVAAIVAGIAAGCRDAGCALLGGETAEHPGVMAPDDLDLAATCVGVVERSDLLDGSAVAAGDVLLGLASSGLHSNGFSLVRQIVATGGLDLETPYGEVLRAALGGEAAGEALAVDAGALGLAPWGDLAAALLEPTRIYAAALLRIRAAVRAADRPARDTTPTDGAARLDVHGIAHVTGGGLPGNVPRIVPGGLAARVDPAAWPVPSVIRLVAAVGGVGGAESRATFNGGIGMVVALPGAGVAAAVAAARAAGIPAWVIGDVVPVGATGGLRYVEELR